MRFSLNSKLALIFALATTQGLCLAWGVVVFGAWLENSMRDTVHQQVLKDNVQAATQMAKLIREMRVKDPRTDLESWRRLQDAVTEISLPNDGFVCLTDASSGQLLCHPRLRERPEFSVISMTKKSMAGPPMKNPPMAKAADWKAADSKADGAPAPGGPMANKAMPSKEPWGGSPKQEWGVGGKIVQTAEGLEIVGAAHMPEINARVYVHQLGSGIDQAVARVTEPVRPIGIAVALGLVALTTVGAIGLVRRYESRLAAINRNLEKLVQKRTKSLMKTRNGLIFGLAKLAESRDTDTGEHLERIATYVTILAKQLQGDGFRFSDTDIEHMALASSLHDIGKVGVPDAVLLKPGRLDAEEREVIETHAAIGGDCLRALGDQLGEDDFLQVAEEIAYGHHEKWDGSGYPFQRAGEQIPLSARIVAVADVYDALRSKRPYKDGMPHEKAKAILVGDAGSHFDPVVIEAFLAAEEAFRGVQPDAVAAPLEDPHELVTL